MFVKDLSRVAFCVLVLDASVIILAVVTEKPKCNKNEKGMAKDTKKR